MRFWLIPITNYPVYGVNSILWDTPELNSTGYFTVDVLKKYARAEVNLTEDGSQNLQLIGYIPDARSGYLDIWRNYEEIRVIDISSYLKMNHSRLITGRFQWRPELKEELRNKFNRGLLSIYNLCTDGIELWLKSLYSETIETLNLVYGTVKTYNQDFFEDLNRLSVLQEDLEDLRLFANQSYEANDFYLKTIVNFTLTIMDELSIRDQIENVPKIFIEMWQVMGNSGEALRKSVVQFIETINNTFNNVLNIINRFFHGDFMQYITELLEQFVYKYDRFIKSLHIKSMRWMDNLWNKFWHRLTMVWRSIIRHLEPYIFKVISNLETITWKFSKDILNFIHNRSAELAQSPYFNKVSNFAHDVEHLYKDIKSHDAITNIRNYSSIIWNFLKEKYFKLVPFGVELNDILLEIWEEIKELQKIEQIRVVLEKYYELRKTIEWLVEELRLHYYCQEVYNILARKLTYYLQSSSAYLTSDLNGIDALYPHEPKTEFIFYPEIGLISLKQRLPMPWHAFNETPNFQKIPEYSFFTKLQDTFNFNNVSLLHYVYNLRQRLDPKTWFPPYDGKLSD